MPRDRPPLILLLTSSLIFLPGQVHVFSTVKVLSLRAAAGVDNRPLPLSQAWPKPGSRVSTHLSVIVTVGFTLNVFWGKRFH